MGRVFLATAECKVFCVKDICKVMFCQGFQVNTGDTGRSTCRSALIQVTKADQLCFLNPARRRETQGVGGIIGKENHVFIYIQSNHLMII